MQSTAPSERPAGGPLRRLTSGAMEVLFPARCGVCDAPLRHAPNPWFCGPCWAAMRVYAPGPQGACACCGCRIPAGHAPPGWRCGDCIRDPPAYALARVLGPYEGALAEGIKLMKFHDRPALARALVDRAVDGFAWTALGETWDADLIVPVPLHAARLRRRGFNQAARLGVALASRIGRPVGDDVLERVRATPPQVGLNRKARADNVRGAFRVANPGPVTGARVLLVDDVITTGATIRACAKVLVRAGANRVTVWALARPEGLDAAWG